MKLEYLSWNVFAETGRVEDYLRYKGESNRYAWEKETEKQRSSYVDRAGEEAVWEKPLR